jgi:hypothetical protein
MAARIRSAHPRLPSTVSVDEASGRIDLRQEASTTAPEANW